MNDSDKPIIPPGTTGGTMEGQHQRTVDMLEEMMGYADIDVLAEMLWFLHDTQTDNGGLRRLAEITSTRATRRKS